jgi:hypothetical protein
VAAAARGRSGFPSRVTVGHKPAYIRRHYTVSHQAPQGELSFLSCVSCLSSRLVTAGGCRTAPLASASRFPTSMPQHVTRAPNTALVACSRASRSAACSSRCLS